MPMTTSSSNKGTSNHSCRNQSGKQIYAGSKRRRSIIITCHLEFPLKETKEGKDFRWYKKERLYILDTSTLAQTLSEHQQISQRAAAAL
jgi:hypothetical protein